MVDAPYKSFVENMLDVDWGKVPSYKDQLDEVIKNAAGTERSYIDMYKQEFQTTYTVQEDSADAVSYMTAAKLKDIADEFKKNVDFSLYDQYLKFPLYPKNDYIAGPIKWDLAEDVYDPAQFEELSTDIKIDGYCDCRHCQKHKSRRPESND